jgi:pimeloyl-ACP methyl ester carboxylesterase
MADLIDQYDGIAPMSVLGMHQAPLDVQHLPGIIIFVHGVNSDGEWYQPCEDGLVRGLNRRMGLDQSSSGLALSPVTYAAELKPNGDMNTELDGKNFIADPGFSPVIRFRWGYKAAGRDNTEGSQDEKVVYGSRIYLNELDAWGGGPFQNGTSALPYMWGLGLDDRVFWWIYANMFPVEGREVYASPPRAYYAHAAHRLKELIKAIRDKQSDCPITVVCHSQGNMVTLGAAMLGEKEDALADTYVMSNPPYSLESLSMDKIVNDDAKAATGQFGSVTTVARKATMANFLKLVKKRGDKTRSEQPLDIINRYHEFKHPTTQEQLFKLEAFPGNAKAVPAKGVDRDNRGRTFLYCNPHDQVIGVTPVQGIGWRGVSQAQLGEIGADGVFHQRVWAMAGGEQSPLFSVGAPEWTARGYRYIEDNHDPKRFWNPPAPRMRFTLSLNESQGALSSIVTVLSAPILWIVTRLYGFSINDDPKRDWVVPITAPALPQAHTPKASRYGQSTTFDQGEDPARDALAKADNKDKLRDGAHGGAYDEGGQGDVGSEAGLRYEIKARLRREERQAEKDGKTISEEDKRASVKRMMAENPNATDHSTILTTAENSERVLAYDVAIGWINPNKITKEDLLAFRQFANWMVLQEAVDRLPVAKQFVGYWNKGFYEGKQLHRTYTMEHMTANAPGIVDQRERSILGHIRA